MIRKRRKKSRTFKLKLTKIVYHLTFKLLTSQNYIIKKYIYNATTSLILLLHLTYFQTSLLQNSLF